MASQVTDTSPTMREMATTLRPGTAGLIISAADSMALAVMATTAALGTCETQQRVSTGL